ncbi:hypothetical protein ARMSODRAFT_1046824 [Armillaria solidipes]|uniref:Uncharacterized protein n=1 Tax=Armillaria solidipes TaxID=1076256 RepID=A0A2H3B715_9AGAR|nr:hypothetical protein ARMSODRAFT_1046824 [Armillaria solidipes]
MIVIRPEESKQLLTLNVDSRDGTLRVKKKPNCAKLLNRAPQQPLYLRSTNGIRFEPSTSPLLERRVIHLYIYGEVAWEREPTIASKNGICGNGTGCVESGDIATINETVGDSRDNKEREEMRERLCVLIGVGGLKPWLDVFSTVGEPGLMQLLSSEVSGDMTEKAAAAPSDVFPCPVEWNAQGSLRVRAGWDNTSQGQTTQH